MPEMEKKILLGWDVEFEIPDKKLKFGVDEIQQVSLGIDVNSGVPMCKIVLKLDTSFSDWVSKNHVGTLTIVNKNFIDTVPQEIYKIELQSVVQMARYVRREASEDDISYKPAFFPLKYYCRSCAVLQQKKVGGTYFHKTLEAVIKDLYKQTGCQITLDMKTPDNKKAYENIFVPQSNFTTAVKNLNYTYGIYNSQLIMFGDTFIQDSSKTFKIASVNNITSQEINLHYMADTKEKIEVKPITSKNYYTYMPINIDNAISRIMQKLPKKLTCISLDGSTFFTKKVIDVKNAIGKVKFLKNSDQFQNDKNFQFDDMLVTCNRSENFDYTIQDALQRIATGAIKTNIITIPNPFLIQHWKIGNVINYTSEQKTYIKSDVKFFVFGTLLIWRQSANGGSWECTLKVRPGAASTVD